MANEVRNDARVEKKSQRLDGLCHVRSRSTLSKGNRPSSTFGNSSSSGSSSARTSSSPRFFAMGDAQSLSPRRSQLTLDHARLMGPGHHLLSTALRDLHVWGALVDNKPYDDLVADAELVELGAGLQTRVVTLVTLIALKRRTRAPRTSPCSPCSRRRWRSVCRARGADQFGFPLHEFRLAMVGPNLRRPSTKRL